MEPESNRGGPEISDHRVGEPHPAVWDAERFAGLSSGQAALLYHFEDLMLERRARCPLTGELAVRSAGAIARLIRMNGGGDGAAEAVIVSAAMTESRPSEGFVLSQLRGVDAPGDAGRFVLPMVDSRGEIASRGGSQPWRWLTGVESFSCPVGVVGHVASGREGIEIFPAYSPEAQEEAIGHIEAIAAAFNGAGGGSLGRLTVFPAASLLLARVLDRVFESNAHGDPAIYGGEAPLNGPPILGVSHLTIERGREVAFNVEVVAVRVGDRSWGGAGKVHVGGLFVKDYTVAAKRGPLAFESVRIVDLVERAA